MFNCLLMANMRKRKTTIILLSSFILLSPFCSYADEEAELAKKLANPVASLISVPFQYNYDENYGLNDEGSKHYMNVQPVIPISISEDLNIISRTIVPLIDQENIPSGYNESGVGDVLQSFFVSPSKPTAGGLIWGLGPALILPTASDETLGGEKWAAGPTFVGLKQEGPWTYGVLTNHLWSYAGTDVRNDINATFIQPFLTYITKTKTTFALNTESTYDWQSNNWNVPVNFIVSQLFKVNNQPMQFGVGPRYWAESPTGGAEEWGARAVFTLLFPK
jgi:hypothetical protein